MKKLLDLAFVLDNLSRIPRMGSVLFSGLNPTLGENIAAHSFKVTWLTMIFCKMAKDQGLPVDSEKMIKYALTHDWAESILLDVPSNAPSYQSYFENISLRDVMNSAETKALKKMAEYVSDSVDISDVRSDLSDIEFRLFTCADSTAFLIEIVTWKHQGLKYDWFDNLWSNTITRLKKSLNGDLAFLQEFVEELERAFEKGSRPVNPFLTLSQFQTLDRKN